MERSAIYLTINENISITEVALNYGYSDASSYNKAFKKHFKKTPLQFRKARKDNKYCYIDKIKLDIDII